MIMESQDNLSVGDAPPHDDYQDEPDTMKTAAKPCRLGMTINTIQCVSGWHTASLAIDVQHAEGKYFAIAQDGGVQAIRLRMTTAFRAWLKDRRVIRSIRRRRRRGRRNRTRSAVRRGKTGA